MARKCPACAREMEENDPAEEPQEEELLTTKHTCKKCHQEGVPIMCLTCRKVGMKLHPTDLAGYKVRRGDVLHSRGCPHCQPKAEKYTILEREEWQRVAKNGAN